MPADRKERKLDVQIKEMTQDDVEAVLDIETLSYANPWSERQLHKWLRRKNIVCCIAKFNERPIGFFLMEIFRDYFHIIDIATHPEFRELGVGQKMFDFLANQLIPTKRSYITIYVRESNLMAQLFFRNCGLRAVEILRQYYNDTKEDCYRMEYRLRWPIKITKNDKKGRYAKLSS